MIINVANHYRIRRAEMVAAIQLALCSCTPKDTPKDIPKAVAKDVPALQEQPHELVLDAVKVIGKDNAITRIDNYLCNPRRGNCPLKYSNATAFPFAPNGVQPVSVFVSYAHLDRDFVERFAPHLDLLTKQFYIRPWRDCYLVPGEKWEQGLMEALRDAELVLFFYSTASRTSKFIREKELSISLDRSEAGKCILLWVPLDRKDLDKMDPLEKRLETIQSATLDARPIHDFKRELHGWRQVEDAIRRAVEKRRGALRPR